MEPLTAGLVIADATAAATGGAGALAGAEGLAAATGAEAGLGAAASTGVEMSGFNPLANEMGSMGDIAKVDTAVNKLTATSTMPEVTDTIGEIANLEEMPPEPDEIAEIEGVAGDPITDSEVADIVDQADDIVNGVDTTPDLDLDSTGTDADAPQSDFDKLTTERDGLLSAQTTGSLTEAQNQRLTEVQQQIKDTAAQQEAAAASTTDAGSTHEIPVANATPIESAPTAATAPEADPQVKLHEDLKQQAKAGTISEADSTKLNQMNEAATNKTRLQELNNKMGEGTPLSPSEKAEQTRLQRQQQRESPTAPAPQTEPTLPNNMTRAQKEASLREHNELNGIKGEAAEENVKKGLENYDKQYAEENPNKEQEMTTEQQKQKLDSELKQTQEDYINGKITAEQANERLDKNVKTRQKLVDTLVNRLSTGEKGLSPFEKEVAETGAKVHQLMLEIRMAPRVFESMERTLKQLQKKYDETKSFQITEENANSDEAVKNTEQRQILSFAIARQSTHMARYTDIVSINVNEFISANSKLDTLVGTRSAAYDWCVQIGTNMKRKSKHYQLDAVAKTIAKSR